MAVVLLGGLVTTTLVSLFVLPALYLRFGGGEPTGPPTAEEEHAVRLGGADRDTRRRPPAGARRRASAGARRARRAPDDRRRASGAESASARASPRPPSLALAAVPLAGCTEVESEQPSRATSPPSSRRSREGDDLKRVTFTAEGARAHRPRDRAGARERRRARVVPYAALIYDAEGKTCVYTSPSR